MTPPTPPPSRFPETADIETSSDAYAARFAGPTGEWMLAVQESITRAMLAEEEVQTILDVGGGHGQLAEPLCRLGYQVTVLGSDPVCMKRLGAAIATGRCRFDVGNVIALPLPDQSFDAVISFRLLPHCERWPKLMAELCRVARRVVIVDYPTTQSLNCVAPALFGAKKKLEGNTRTWRSFRHAEIASECARHRFEKVRREGEFFWPMVIHRLLKRPGLSRLLEAPFQRIGATARMGSPVVFKARRKNTN